MLALHSNGKEAINFLTASSNLPDKTVEGDVLTIKFRKISLYKLADDGKGNDFDSYWIRRISKAVFVKNEEQVKGINDVLEPFFEVDI